MSTPSIQNRKAFHDYSIEENLRCRFVLQGTEVKSLRKGKVSLMHLHSLGMVKHGLGTFYIKPFEHGSFYNHDPRRDRKLLLSKKEIRELDQVVLQKGNTIIPLKFF